MINKTLYKLQYSFRSIVHVFCKHLCDFSKTAWLTWAYFRFSKPCGNSSKGLKKTKHEPPTDKRTQKSMKIITDHDRSQRNGPPCQY